MKVEAYVKFNMISIKFNHPIKELIWTFQNFGLIYKTGSHLEKYQSTEVKLSTNYWRGFKVGKRSFN